MSVENPGFFVGGLVLRQGHLSVKMYAKMKELDLEARPQTRQWYVVKYFFLDYPEQRLIDKLKSDYSYRVRPVKNPDETVNVTMSFYLTKVVSLVSFVSILLSYFKKNSFV